MTWPALTGGLARALAAASDAPLHAPWGVEAVAPDGYGARFGIVSAHRPEAALTGYVSSYRAPPFVRHCDEDGGRAAR